MRIIVTPLGASGASAGQVARRIVEYLHGTKPSPGRELISPTNPDGRSGGTVGYFSDSMEGPGGWLGDGASNLNLNGRVVAADLEAVLAGRDPHTGMRLVGATGSSQRSQLRAGTPARFDRDGTAWFEVRDAAVLLGVAKADVVAMVAEGDRLAVNRPDGERFNVDGGVASWLRCRRDSPDILIARSEIDRWLDLTEVGVTAEAISRTGPDDGLLSTTQAAALLGVSRRYVTRLCGRFHHIDRSATGSDGTWIRCERVDTHGKVSYRIARGDLADYATHRRPAVARCGFDLTLTTEKSFGITMMLTDPATRTVFETALNDANEVAVSYLETHATFTRRLGERVKGGGLIVASFLHGTSRALDPFPHRHNVVANATVDTNGDRKTLDARALYEHGPAGAAVATAQARWALTTHFGVQWRLSRRGVWEIDGIGDDLINEFSQRRNAIDLAAHELETILGRPATWYDERRLAIETREPKVPTTTAELFASWWTRAEAHGMTAGALAAVLTGVNTPTVWTVELRDWLFDHLAGPDGITANLNWFTRPDVIVALASVALPDRFGGGPLLLTAEQIVDVADLFLCTTDVVSVQLPHAELRAGSGEPAYTTVDLLETQTQIRDAYTAGFDAAAGIVPDAIITNAIVEAEQCSDFAVTLSADQRGLVNQFCSSGMAIQAAIGPPGSGKTAAMAAAARAWQTAGYRVIGAAVKGEAARLLSDAAGIDTNSLAWWLTKHDTGGNPFDPNTIVIVDEGSTIADRDLRRLIGAVTESGAALRIVGDPAQHGAVGAGGSFRSLTERHRGDTPQLIGNRRLTSAPERHAADLVRNGAIDQALNVLAANNQLDVADTERHAHIIALTRWWNARQTSEPHPMVDRVNDTRRTLNHLAHNLRLHAGELEPGSARIIAGTEYCVGDHVIAKQPARHLHPDADPDHYIRNGATGTIIDLNDNGATIAFTGLGTITVPTDFIAGQHHQPGLDLGYAVTSYAVQGATYDQSTSIVTPASSQPELYVNITRGRHHNHVIAVTPTPPNEDEPHLPRLPPPPLLAAIEHSVKHRRGETAIIDLDPDAYTAIPTRQPSPTPRTTQRQQWVTQTLRRLPPNITHPPYQAQLQTVEPQAHADPFNPHIGQDPTRSRPSGGLSL